MFLSNLIDKIKTKLAKRRLEAKARRQLEKQKKEWYNRSATERLATLTCEWVRLSWNGKACEFLINNINVADLAVSGRYPNVIVYFMKLAKQASQDAEEDDIDVDMKKVKEEEQALYEEVARQSMITPSFQETYDSILKVRKERGIEIKITCIRDVIPYDFLQELFKYHLERWVQGIKKNLDASTSIASAG